MSEFEFVQYGAFIAAAFCVLGHDFPVFFGFKGGKGVLTSWSITLLIDWRLFVITIVVFIVLLLITRWFQRFDCRCDFPSGFSLSADIFCGLLAAWCWQRYLLCCSVVDLFIPRRPAYLEAPLEYQTHSGRNGKEA